ncbi:hypothetical protein DFO63_3907 [Stenotrophomonas sp. AG209]|uniref:hypothetical protein n=1 Tax=Stenotrophomonas sp. AG209 TaxID=2183909 RepID=UPI000E5BACF2|nr:hypothetical protein [Stenotrophomonas sp. AG209]RIA19537.1 hypothetical protein DFO63_3907 [Stenotrophomonas sp. AG209]
MSLLEAVEKHWDIIEGAPWFFLSYGFLCVSLGFGAAYMLFKERLDTMKVRLEKAKEDLGSPKPEPVAIPPSDGLLTERILFPATSPNGRNILSPSVNTVAVKEFVGVKAIVPRGQRLMLRMEGLGPQQQDAAWSWRLGGTTTGWDNDIYNSESVVPMQMWNAWEGTADLKFQFHRAGEVRLHLASEDGTFELSKTLSIRS